MKDPEILKREALYKPIPNNSVDITVGATSGSVELNNLTGGVDVSGQWIRLKAIDDDINYLRGTHTLTTSTGLQLATGEEEEFYVDPNGDMTLSHIASGAGKTLRVFYNDDVAT